MNVDRKLIDGGDGRDLYETNSGNACTLDLDTTGVGKITMQFVANGTLSNLVLLILQK